MNKKRIIIIGLVLVVALAIVGIYGTFATSTTVSEVDNVYNITLTSPTEEVRVPAGSSKTVFYQITNTNKGIVQYAVAYTGDNITVKVYEDSIDPVTGTFDYGETKFVKLYIKNSGTTEKTATIKAVLGYEKGGELTSIVPTGYTLVTEVYSPPTGPTLLSYITNLYLDNKDATPVPNNGIEYTYASSKNLMNDRQGSMDVGEDEGNIRYYGANPNNYIYFNCSNYSNQTADTCELWRIIGIVDGKVKIARATVFDSDMAWNSANTNNWENASLKTYLNEDYYTSLETKNPDTLDLISYSTWYLGGWDTSSGLYANDIYKHERTNSEDTIYTGNPPSIEANIGLMYASDYSYATDLSVCTKDIYNYDTDATNCREKDWLLKSGVGTQTNTTQWLITPRSSNSNYAWLVYSTGAVSYNGVSVTIALGVRAVLYLDSELAIESGHKGTNIDPYRISVS